MYLSHALNTGDLSVYRSDVTAIFMEVWFDSVYYSLSLPTKDFANYRYNATFLIFYLMGLGGLLPWNFFINAQDVRLLPIADLYVKFHVCSFAVLDVQTW